MTDAAVKDCPNPNCDEGLSRGSYVGCAVCRSPITKERLDRAVRERAGASTSDTTITI